MAQPGRHFPAVLLPRGRCLRTPPSPPPWLGRSTIVSRLRPLALRPAGSAPAQCGRPQPGASPAGWVGRGSVAGGEQPLQTEKEKLVVGWGGVGHPPRNGLDPASLWSMGDPTLGSLFTFKNHSTTFFLKKRQSPASNSWGARAGGLPNAPKKETAKSSQAPERFRGLANVQFKQNCMVARLGDPNRSLVAKGDPNGFQEEPGPSPNWSNFASSALGRKPNIIKIWTKFFAAFWSRLWCGHFLAWRSAPGWAKKNVQVGNHFPF